VVNGDQTLMDAIVYGERLPYQWMNGSEMWYRTPANNGGYGEYLSAPNVIMIAIVYNSADAQKIRLYRNGSLYAQHNTGSLIGFDASAKVVIGPRQMLGTEPQGYFNGSITEARVYQGALSAEDIARLHQAGPDSVPDVLPPETSVVVASGATLDLNGGVHSLAALSGAGTVANGSLTVTGALSPGTDGQTPGALNIASDLTLSPAVSLHYDYNASVADTVHVDGTLTITGANTVTLTAINSSCPPSRVTLFTFGALAGRENLADWSLQTQGLDQFEVTLNTDETSVYVRIRRIGTLIKLL